MKNNPLSFLIFFASMFALQSYWNSQFSNSVRVPASEEGCTNIVNSIINSKKISPEAELVDTKLNQFWIKHKGRYIGGKLVILRKETYKKLKEIFMEVNHSFRPIYYIQNDDASYVKIFHFIELKNKALAGELTPENDLSKIEQEVFGWLETYKNYREEMNAKYAELATNSYYIRELKKLKSAKNLDYPFEVELFLYKDGASKSYKSYIEAPSAFDELIIKLKGRNRKISGSFFHGTGEIEIRDFEQAILRQRLKFLERELRDQVANNNSTTENYYDLIQQLKNLNKDESLFPSVKSELKLEFKEMDEEYKQMFSSSMTNLDKLQSNSKEILEKISPRFRKKLGIDEWNNWAEQFKLGRKGVIWGSVGTLGAGSGTFILKFWEYFNYSADKEFEIINAKDDETFSTNLKDYLKNNFDIERTQRLRKNQEGSMSLKDFNPNNKEDVHFINMINEIIKQRKEYLKEEKILSDAEKVFSDALDLVQNESGHSLKKPETPEKNDRLIKGVSHLPPKKE